MQSTREDLLMAEVQPLEKGERLTRDEFERRHNAMPWIKKAELIEGVVYMPSPVSRRHDKPHGLIMGWLIAYCAATPGVDWGDNGTIRLDPENEIQPDGYLRIEPEGGGHSRIGEDYYVEGAPEFIVEVALTSAEYDLHEKLQLYRRNGVQEYLIWLVQDKRVEWLALEAGEYVPFGVDDNGLLHSRVFPGLNLAVPQLLDGDVASVLAEVQKGVSTPEHRAFVRRLNPRDPVE